MKIELKHKTALITGATRGIGKEVADCFYEAGADLILTGTNANEIANRNAELRKLGINNIEYLHGDFSNPESIKEFVEQLKGIARIDICVNNAGTNIIKDFSLTSIDEFTLLNNINLIAPYEILKVVGPKMLANNYGRVVNIASIWSVVSKQGRSMYTTTKHAMIGLTKTLAIEWASHDVLVNAVSPGFTLTELTKKTNTPEQLLSIEQAIPAKRMAVPIEIARLILFLCSDMNTYLTGQNIVIDGGYTVV